MFGFGKKKSTAASVAETVECPHAVLVARWENVQDMGKEDKASRFMCEACHEMFTPEQAKDMRQGIAAKLVGQEQAEKS